LPLADGSLLVADAGTWDRGRGRLLRLRPRPPGYSVEVLQTGLNRPHTIVLGPDKMAWMGEDDRIVRFDPLSDHPEFEVVIGELPSTGLHPLKALVFLPDGSLLVNIGAGSDNCSDSRGMPACPEAEGAAPRGSLWRFTLREGIWHREVYARGLRNSIALHVDLVNDRVWAAENARDAIGAVMQLVGSDEDVPHDRLVQVHAGANYGWPYCYDDGLPSPEFPKTDCRQYDRALRLLPGHAAPLGLEIYRNPRLTAPWSDALVVTYHGYRNNGHRIVAFPLDPHGEIAGDVVALVDAWNAIPDKAPLGAPTDVRSDRLGNLWVTEDRNGTLLRISPPER
jgi:glucose/arabinose dehydrogenase